MQRNVNNNDRTLFSKEFVCSFKQVIREFYSYEEYMDFLIVTSLWGKKTLSYLPILSYTDRDIDSISDLLELSKENDYQIRVLNFNCTDFKNGDPVVMRIYIDGRGSDEILMENMKSKYRKTVKNSIRRNSFIFKSGNNEKYIEDFYTIYSGLMYNHGTPSLDKYLFFNLSEELSEDIVFYNVYDKKNIVGSFCLFFDNDLAYGAWGGIDKKYRDKLLGQFSYWNIIKDLADNRKMKVFDFGRSSYGSGGYVFKYKFGAKAVKTEIVTSQRSDIYTKYSLASKIWKNLPKSTVDFLGPKLCKYLVDL